MNIGPYISELLYDYECVVLPGFGGFIVNDKPASINRITHQFKPPFRQIIFNVHLSANDGLLTDHIAHTEGLTYQEVKTRLDAVVAAYRKQLEKGQKVFVGKIGELYFDENKHIVFDQNTATNYNPNSFGLTGFVSPSISRTTDQQKIKGIISGREKGTSKPVDRKPAATKKQRVTRKKESSFSLVRSLAVAGIMVLILGIGWGVTNRDEVKNYWENNASAIPLFYNNVNDYVLNSFGRLALNDDKSLYTPRENADFSITKEVTPVEILNNEVSKTEITENKEVIVPDLKTETLVLKEEPEIKPDIVVQKPVVKPTKRKYYIIAGSFSKEKNAALLIQQLAEHGYQAQIADTNQNGMFRVAYLGIEKLKQAKQMLATIRQEQNPEAWILRK